MPEGENNQPAEGGKTEEGKIPYERFQEVVQEKNQYKEKLQEYEEKPDPEEIKEEYESKMSKVKQQATRKEKEFALKEKALTEGVRKDALDDVTKLADLSQIEKSESGLQGVDDVVNQLKQNKSYLFDSDSPDKAGENFKGSSEGVSNDSKARKIMKLD